MKILYFIYKLWIGFVFWTSLLLLYPLFAFYMAKEKRFPKAFKLKKTWSWIIRTMIFCPISIEKRAEFPDPPYIVCSNHCSYLDTVFMYAVVPDYFLFIGKGELLKWPLFKLFFKKMDIPVQRENFKQAHGALTKAYSALQNGECIAIYPEGTIPYDAPKMGRFKNGAFKMAADNNVPIVPISWKNNHEILNDLENLWSKNGPRRSRAVVHEAIYWDENEELQSSSLRKKIFELIASEIDD